MLPPFRPFSSSLDLQGAFAQLSRRGFAGDRLDETLRQLTATTAQMLNIERVSLWGLTAQRAHLECIERGPHSAWTSVQRLFAHAVARLVSVALLQHQLLSKEAELRDANSLRRALFNGARDAILISDARTGHILDANPQVEKLFGRGLQQILGVLQSEPCSGSNDLDTRDLFKLLARTAGVESVRSEVLADNGKLIPVEISGQLIRLEKGEEVVQGVFRPLDTESTTP